MRALDDDHGDVVLLAEIPGGLDDGRSGLGGKLAAAVEAEEFALCALRLDYAIRVEGEAAAGLPAEARGNAANHRVAGPPGD